MVTVIVNVSWLTVGYKAAYMPDILVAVAVKLLTKNINPIKMIILVNISLARLVS